MWFYGAALVTEAVLLWGLFRSYGVRRVRRKQSDLVRLVQEQVKTEKFRLDLAEIQHHRTLLQEFKELFQ